VTVNTKRTNGNRREGYRFDAKFRAIGLVQRTADMARNKSGRILSARASIERNDACGWCAPVGTASRRQQVDLQRTEGRDEADARNSPPELDYDGLAWLVATVYATAISALPSPAELKPASAQYGSEAAPRTGFQRGVAVGRSVLLDVSPESVLLGRTQLGSLITRKIVASSMAYLRRQARATCA
jgi:hypothetical protein